MRGLMSTSEGRMGMSRERIDTRAGGRRARRILAGAVATLVALGISASAAEEIADAIVRVTWSVARIPRPVATPT